MIRATTLLTAALLLLSACETGATRTVSIVQPKPHSNVGFSVAPVGAPSGPLVDQFAGRFLDGIQAQSIAERREFCGYFFVDGAGQLQGTPPRRGTFATCEMPEPLAGQGIIASYHTHGAYGGPYDNEVPSPVDLTSDFDYGIDGYVSTPGGRVWLVDYQTRSTRQICGLGCVTSDPSFQPRDEAGIRVAYTVPELRRRNASF